MKPHNRMSTRCKVVSFGDFFYNLVQVLYVLNQL